MKKIIINLKQKKIPVIIGKPLSKFGKFFGEFLPSKKAFILTNPAVKKIYGEKIAKTLRLRKVEVIWQALPAGEEAKNLKTAERIYKKCITSNMDRTSTIIALGGGVVGDIAGFVASTIFRGIRYVQIPTTLLSMVDSSVGGKTGVDLPEGKNLVGAFWQPEFIYVTTDFLKTLPQRELLSGLAEVIKYGVISNKNLFAYLEKANPKRLDWNYIIESSIKTKGVVVEKDEREEVGIREILNFGHTFGHAIEAITKYKKYTHGEAVAIGMIYECAVAEKFAGFNETYRVRNLLSAYGLPSAESGFYINPSEFLKAISLDKKVKGKNIRLVLPSKIGKPIYLNLPLEVLCAINS